MSEKIVKLAAPKGEDNSVKQSAPMSVENVIAMRKGIARLRELQSTKVRTAEIDEEQAALANGIGQALFQHADEFTGAWLAYRQEYAPLVRGVSALLTRAAMSAPMPDNNNNNNKPGVVSEK